ncbi:MAG: nitroreductase family protein [Candidatus Muirbacterium halophilum]|nr:nitroreductase family protein [Candidatus Muirbacterium halophilum]MCK9475400.1 nitroreductase family protein [Candidatus Muirbacterium halophilum]
MELIEIIEKRFSARKYTDKKIEIEKENKIIEALRLAPSGKNTQPWKFILVKTDEIKQKMKKACKGQVSVGEAQLLIVGCGYPEKAYTAMGGYWNSVTCDVSIALTQAMLVAKEVGLDTCWIGAFYEDDVKDILEIPENIMVVSILTVGYSNEQSIKTRLKQEDIVCYEKFYE